jgi:hypothetical protein
MIKALQRRLGGLALAVITFPLASVALLKGLPPPFLSTGFEPASPLWRWIWAWMPAIHFEVRPKSWTDYASSALGIIALGAVLVGLGIAFGKRKTKVVRRWEEEL